MVSFENGLTTYPSGLDLRFKISAPADQFTTASGVPGAAAQPGAQGPNGINVLLHGDGGQSFFDFPNQAVQQGLMGVVVLAPSGTSPLPPTTSRNPGSQSAQRTSFGASPRANLKAFRVWTAPPTPRQSTI